MRPLVVIGAPTSAGSYAAGQELAPKVLREHGLIERLRAGGREVVDAGDGPLQVWHPDTAHPLAQNFEEAAAAIRAVASMASDAFSTGADILVLGGNCTIALGVLSAMPDAALLYLDRHFDLNTPDSTSDGALDWMGMAAGLGLLPDAPDFGFPRKPVLDPSQLYYLGVDPDAATDWERSQVASLGISWRSLDDLVASPSQEIDRALDWAENRDLAIHLDLDLLDFTDLPLAENTDGRNTGPSLDALTSILERGCAHPGFRALSIGELNPTRAAGTPDALPRFVDALGRALAG